MFLPDELTQVKAGLKAFFRIAEGWALICRQIY